MSIEGKIIRKYRDIFSRIPESRCIPDIVSIMDKDPVIINNVSNVIWNIPDDTTLEIIPLQPDPHQTRSFTPLDHLRLKDWTRSRGLREHDISFDDSSNKFTCDVSYCPYLKSIVEFVIWLHENKVRPDVFHRSIYSTEISRSSRR